MFPVNPFTHYNKPEEVSESYEEYLDSFLEETNKQDKETTGQLT